MAPRVLLGLIAGPLLVLVISALVVPRWDGYWRVLHETSPGGPYFVDATVHFAQAPKVVVFGSSVANRNVDERILASRLDAEVVNLGVPGIRAAGSAMWVPDIIRLKPEIALFVVGPSALEVEDTTWLEKWHPGIAWESFGPAGIARDLEGHLDGLLGWLVPPHRHRQGLRYRMERGALPHLHPRDKPPLRRAQMVAQLAGVDGQLKARVVDGTGPNAEAARVMQRRLSAAGIHLLVAPSPIHPAITDESIPTYVSEVLRALARETGADVLPPHVFGFYPPVRFNDPLHLNHRGQEIYTNQLGEQLEQRLGALP